MLTRAPVRSRVRRGRLLTGAAVRTRFRSVATMMERLRDASNAHDAARMADLFAHDYDSAQPAHPGRAFVGAAQVLANWTGAFQAVPDFVTELLASASDGDTEWAEWSWHGTESDGSPFAMRGVTIFLVRDGSIAAGRLYMEPVDAADEDIHAAVKKLHMAPKE